MHNHLGHAASHGADMQSISDSRLLAAVALNQLLTVAQVIAGVISGSIALLSDAAHNFNDANALLIAYVARRVSRKRANRHYTFGYQRAEMIGALINLTLLGVVGVYLIYEGLLRFIQPVAIIGWLMAAASIVALVVDVATAWLLWAMSHGSINVRAAFIHNLVDAFGSLAVLVGALAIIFLDWTWVDPVLTLCIATYILWQVYSMLPQCLRVLMQGTPADLNLEKLLVRVEGLEGVQSMHHLHVWQMDENHCSMEAHVVIAREQAGELEEIKNRVKRCLTEFKIFHSTLEFEFSDVCASQAHDSLVFPDHRHHHHHDP